VRHFSITLDGAYKDTIRTVLPILRSFGLKATFFVVSGTIGRILEEKAVVDKEGLRRIIAEGHEVGAHSVTHTLLEQAPLRKLFDLANRAAHSGQLIQVVRRASVRKVRSAVTKEMSNRIKTTEYIKEAAEAKYVLEELLGIPIESYAYPGGRYNCKVLRQMPELGYSSARSTIRGVNQGRRNIFALRSFVWHNDTAISEFESYLDSIGEGEWGIETLHGVGGAGSIYNISEDIFSKHCELLRSRIGVEYVVTQGRGAKMTNSV
jgi:peptidoglycan/xylan/chitin deacetylase (PgdA/CDA1 family)